MANRLVHALALGSSGNDVVYPIDEFTRFLELSDEQVNELCRVVPEETADLRLQLLMHGARQDDDAIGRFKSMCRKGLRPLVVCQQSATEAVRILLDRLCGADPLDRPNVAVLRVSHSSQRQLVLSALAAEEARAGTGPLPLLVLANGDDSKLKPEAIDNRPEMQISLPVRISRIIEALNELCTASTAPAA